MRIVILAPIEEPVPPAKYGGTELVVYHQAEEMTKKGHEVFLLASGDSKTRAQLVPLIPQSLRKEYSVDEIDGYRNVVKFHQVAKMLQEIQRLQPDVVFNNVGWRFVPFIQFVHCPVFTTIHGSLDSLNERYTYEHFLDTKLVSISDNQRLAMPDLNWVKTVYNGVELPPLEKPIEKDREYFAFLGRTSPEKGLKELCLMIKKTKHRLKIAAKVDSNDAQYFEEEIQPLIDGEQIEFIGEIGPEEKAHFLQHAKGLLLWLNWEEPFGLVVIEALANGAPVLVNPRGAMQEIMIDGQTGFLVRSIDEMAVKLDEVGSIDPEVCRSHIEKRFSARKMAQEYLQLASAARHES